MIKSSLLVIQSLLAIAGSDYLHHQDLQHGQEAQTLVLDSDRIYGVREPEGFAPQNLTCQYGAQIVINTVRFGYTELGQIPLCGEVGHAADKCVATLDISHIECGQQACRFPSLADWGAESLPAGSCGGGLQYWHICYDCRGEDYATAEEINDEEYGAEEYGAYGGGDDSYYYYYYSDMYHPQVTNRFDVEGYEDIKCENGDFIKILSTKFGYDEQSLKSDDLNDPCVFDFTQQFASGLCTETECKSPTLGQLGLSQSVACDQSSGLGMWQIYYTCEKGGDIDIPGKMGDMGDQLETHVETLQSNELLTSVPSKAINQSDERNGFPETTETKGAEEIVGDISSAQETENIRSILSKQQLSPTKPNILTNTEVDTAIDIHEELTNNDKTTFKISLISTQSLSSSTEKMTINDVNDDHAVKLNDKESSYETEHEELNFQESSEKSTQSLSSSTEKMTINDVNDDHAVKLNDKESSYETEHEELNFQESSEKLTTVKDENTGGWGWNWNWGHSSIAKSMEEEVNIEDTKEHEVNNREYVEKMELLQTESKIEETSDNPRPSENHIASVKREMEKKETFSDNQDQSEPSKVDKTPHLKEKQTSDIEFTGVSEKDDRNTPIAKIESKEVITKSDDELSKLPMLMTSKSEETKIQIIEKQEPQTSVDYATTENLLITKETMDYMTEDALQSHERTDEELHLNVIKNEVTMKLHPVSKEEEDQMINETNLLVYTSNEPKNVTKTEDISVKLSQSPKIEENQIMKQTDLLEDTTQDLEQTDVKINVENPVYKTKEKELITERSEASLETLNVENDESLQKEDYPEDISTRRSTMSFTNEALTTTSNISKFHLEESDVDPTGTNLVTPINTAHNLKENTIKKEETGNGHHIVESTTKQFVETKHITIGDLSTQDETISDSKNRELIQRSDQLESSTAYYIEIGPDSTPGSRAEPNNESSILDINNEEHEYDYSNIDIDRNGAEFIQRGKNLDIEPSALPKQFTDPNMIETHYKMHQTPGTESEKTNNFEEHDVPSQQTTSDGTTPESLETEAINLLTKIDAHKHQAVAFGEKFENEIVQHDVAETSSKEREHLIENEYLAKPKEFKLDFLFIN